MGEGTKCGCSTTGSAGSASGTARAAGAEADGSTARDVGTGTSDLKVSQHEGTLTVGELLDWQQGIALRSGHGPHAAYSTSGSPARKARMRRRAIRVRRSSLIGKL